MNKLTKLIPVFVDVIPENLEHGKIYISLKYRTATHLCACGCGSKVVTPLKDGFWKISVNESINDNKEIVMNIISLSPSIGNFDLPCKSHYFIRDNKINWV